MCPWFVPASVHSWMCTTKKTTEKPGTVEIQFVLFSLTRLIGFITWACEGNQRTMTPALKAALCWLTPIRPESRAGLAHWLVISIACSQGSTLHCPTARVRTTDSVGQKWLKDQALLLSLWKEHFPTVENTARTVLAPLPLFTMHFSPSKNGNMTRTGLKEPVSTKMVNACLCYRGRGKEFGLFMQVQPLWLFGPSLWLILADVLIQFSHECVTSGRMAVEWDVWICQNLLENLENCNVAK